MARLDKLEELKLYLAYYDTLDQVKLCLSLRNDSLRRLSLNSCYLPTGHQMSTIASLYRNLEMITLYAVDTLDNLKGEDIETVPVEYNWTQFRHLTVHSVSTQKQFIQKLFQLESYRTIIDNERLYNTYETMTRTQERHRHTSGFLKQSHFYWRQYFRVKTYSAAIMRENQQGKEKVFQACAEGIDAILLALKQIDSLSNIDRHIEEEQRNRFIVSLAKFEVKKAKFLRDVDKQQKRAVEMNELNERFMQEHQHEWQDL